MIYKIKVLDHGYVEYIDHMGSDSRIIEFARQCTGLAACKGEEADKKLLRYLYINKHTTPFEAVKLTLAIKMPIFVMRQYVRHRMQNLNEVSARYSVLPNEFYIPDDWRRQDTKNKQGSLPSGHFNPIIPGSFHGREHQNNATMELLHHSKKSYALYVKMLEAGIAREMARMVLPVNIYTHIMTTWDLKNLLHFIALRDDSHAQAEIQEYGRAIKTICQKLWPWTMEIYEEVRSKQCLS